MYVIKVGWPGRSRAGKRAIIYKATTIDSARRRAKKIVEAGPGGAYLGRVACIYDLDRWGSKPECIGGYRRARGPYTSERASKYDYRPLAGYRKRRR